MLWILSDAALHLRVGHDLVGVFLIGLLSSLGHLICLGVGLHIELSLGHGWRAVLGLGEIILGSLLHLFLGLSLGIVVLGIDGGGRGVCGVRNSLLIILLLVTAETVVIINELLIGAVLLVLLLLLVHRFILSLLVDWILVLGHGGHGSVSIGILDILSHGGVDLADGLFMEGVLYRVREGETYFCPGSCTSRTLSLWEIPFHPCDRRGVGFIRGLGSHLSSEFRCLRGSSWYLHRACPEVVGT